MRNVIAVFLLYAVIMLSCGSGSSGHDLSFKMTVSEPGNTQIPFAPGDYAMMLDRISVMSGSNSGIEFRWSKDESESKKLVFTVFLPSSKKFSVWNSSEEKVECAVPELPFTLTEKDFDSVYSVRAHQKISAYMSLNRENQIMSDQTNVDYLSFSVFKITMKEFRFNKNRITAGCEFEASLSEDYKKFVGTNYSISGTFGLDNIQTGIVLVDD